VLVVTTDTLPGYEIKAILGEVLGVTASSRNPFATGVRATEPGGVTADVASVLVQTRARAIGQMIHAARSRGANAIVGMRFDNRDITTAWVEICAYGTAVVAVPVTEDARVQHAAVVRSGRMPHHEPYETG
jgi:uncharacterized protein YbjQ (UPF0145 family)